MCIPLGLFIKENLTCQLLHIYTYNIYIYVYLIEKILDITLFPHIDEKIYAQKGEFFLLFLF